MRKILYTIILIICSSLYTTAQDNPSPTPHDFDLLPTLNQLMVENGNCDLPCWWGFTIGESKTNEWLAFLDDQGFLLEENFLYLDISSVPSEFYLIFDSENTNLTYLNVIISYPNEWLSVDTQHLSLPYLLQRLDNPQIFVSRQSTLRRFDLMIIDDEMGVKVTYTFDITELPNGEPNEYDTLNLCLGIENTTRINLEIFDVSTIDEPLSAPIWSLIENSDRPPFHPIENTDSIGVKSEIFTEFFVNSPDECLVVSELEGITQGDSTPEFNPTRYAEQLEVALERFHDLLIVDNECELPCWLGFQVGETKFDEWSTFWERHNLMLSYYDDSNETAGVYFFTPATDATESDETRIEYVFDDEVLVVLNIIFGHPNQYFADIQSLSMPRVLATFDDIPTVYRFTGSRITDYQLVFFDDEKGLMLRYTFDLQSVQPNVERPFSDFHICLGLDYITRIEITTRDTNYFDTAISEKIRPLINVDEGFGYETAEEAFEINMDNETFVEFFIDNPDECLVVSEVEQ
jgi:hypothetical protein